MAAPSKRTLLPGLVLVALTTCLASHLLAFTSFAPAGLRGSGTALVEGRQSLAGVQRNLAERQASSGMAAQPADSVRPRRLAAIGAGLATLALAASPAAAVVPAAAATMLAVPFNWVSMDKLFLLFTYAPAAYALPLMLLPRWHNTKRFGKSFWPVLLMGAIWLYVAYTAVSLGTDPLPFAKDLVLGKASLAGWQSLLQNDSTIRAASLCLWCSLKFCDMFIGRYIYLDSIRSKTFALHSMLVTVCINGILGYVLHSVTKLFGGSSKSGIAEAVEEEDPLPFDPSM